MQGLGRSSSSAGIFRQFREKAEHFTQEFRPGPEEF
jgi:hypothetical protein